MTKNERHQMNLAAYYRAAGYRDLAARTLAIIHRSARRSATQSAVLARVVELELGDRVVMFNGCLAHVDDVPAVRS